MPYKSTWYDPPTNKALTVTKELPEGIKETGLPWHRNRKEATGIVGNEYKRYCYCPECGGWIEGRYYTAPVNTLDPRHLAGRRGTEYYCPCCGYEVDFDGMVS